MHRSIVPLLCLLLLAAGTSANTPGPWPEDTTEPSRWWPDLHYHGPDGCTAPPLLPILHRPAGSLKVLDEDGDGTRDAGDAVVLSGSSTIQVGDVVLTGPAAGRVPHENQEPAGAPLTDVGTAWTYVDLNGDGTYSRGDAVLLDAAHASGTRTVQVGDVVVSAASPDTPTEVQPGHPFLNHPLALLDATVAARDRDGDAAWSHGDELRLLHAGEARFGDLLLGQGGLAPVVTDVDLAELPLPIDLDLTLRKGPDGTYYLAAGDAVSGFDLRREWPLAWSAVRGSDPDFQNPTTPVPGHLAFVSDGTWSGNGALYWDADADGVVSDGDVSIRGAESSLGAPLVRLDAPLRAFDGDWNGFYSLHDDVFVDVDGNGRITRNDQHLTDDDRPGLGYLRESDAPGRLYQPTCLETGYVPGLDHDGDGLPDRHDPDADGDGLDWTRDNCWYTPNPDQANLDGDRYGDVCDLDEDGDGVLASDDFDDRDPHRVDGVDSDGDGVDDVWDEDVDGDGTPDDVDNCPRLANDQSDLDGDNNGDACDGDPDGDGSFYDGDDYPMDPERFRKPAGEPDDSDDAGDDTGGAPGGAGNGTDDWRPDVTIDVPAPSAVLALAGLALVAARRVRRTR